MSTSDVTRDDLTVTFQRANRELCKLRDHSESFASDLYDLPNNPTPSHITRMLDDLSALAEGESRVELPDEVWLHYDNTIAQLQILQTLLYQASAPPDPFAEHR